MHVAFDKAGDDGSSLKVVDVCFGADESGGVLIGSDEDKLLPAGGKCLGTGIFLIFRVNVSVKPYMVGK